MNVILILLIVSIFANLSLLITIIKTVKKNQMRMVFTFTLSCLLICTVGQTAQILFADRFNVQPIYFDYFVYIGTCFLPIGIFFIGLVFENTEIKFKKRYLALFVIPILSLIILWTNDFHHLFYESYSVDFRINVYGPYFTIHNIYSYFVLFIGIFYLLRFSIKNSGFFSKQSILIALGTSIPLIVNILGTFQIIPMSIYITPITFTIAILCFAVSIFKFKFLGISAIALQNIVDRISDSYVVIDMDNKVVDFNKTFTDTFKVKPDKLRSKNFIEFLNFNKNYQVNIDKIEKSIEKTKKSGRTISFEQRFEEIEKFFKVEITSISSDSNLLGVLILLKDITQHKEDMETIRDNQDLLIERERLASLGQLIGGIAHNLKTPIMSISGAIEGLEDLINEYDQSIDNPLVNSKDHHDIANDMESWIPKIRTHLRYMSEIITTVRGQAVALSNQDDIYFTVEELVKKVDILMKHELKNALIDLNILMKTDESQVLKGDVNSLVQVVNNMISNSIQAYNGELNKTIELEVNKVENDVIFSVRDFAGGLVKEVQDKLFKEMITTKGKNGTGLGLYMSYSNIKARFGGDITFETEEGKGTTFNIIIPT